ncbi:MAG: hypothetical protein WKG07_03025 [Hymenobacter sp.]
MAPAGVRAGPAAAAACINPQDQRPSAVVISSLYNAVERTQLLGRRGVGRRGLAPRPELSLRAWPDAFLSADSLQWANPGLSPAHQLVHLRPGPAAAQLP